ncbi:MAG: DUF4270 domain-containing protein [Muribaculaceae bacterium]|nr:DUF4270 domain-containing protein [Muribaculaceae bacterium]
MNKFLSFIIAVALGATLWSCDDTTTAAGESLVSGQTQIVRDSVFTVEGVPYASGAVRSRTILQLLGRYSAKGFGQFESDVVCQYMPSAVIDTLDVTINDIDSVKLSLTVYKDGFAGDSVAPMGLSIHRLTKQLPSPIFSDFDPEGYYDPKAIATASYSALFDGYPYVGTDTEGAVFKNIYVDLPIEFGHELFNKYISNPETFSTPQRFSEWFPGLYIANTFGSGRVTRISNNVINLFYHVTDRLDVGTDQERDTVLNFMATYLGVTPEVITNNNISFQMAQELKQRADDGETIIVGPIGYDVEFKFPAREILKRYQEQSGPLAVVNYLRFALPADDISNDYGLTPPPYVLMVKKSKKDEFFAKSQINDDLNSFYATYDASTGLYVFSSMLGYINDIIKKGIVEPEDEEFVICPVQVSFFASNSTSSYYQYYYGYSYNTTSTQVSSITPYVTEPVMTHLDFSKARIEFSFSKQTL